MKRPSYDPLVILWLIPLMVGVAWLVGSLVATATPVGAQRERTPRPTREAQPTVERATPERSTSAAATPTARAARATGTPAVPRATAESRVTPSGDEWQATLAALSTANAGYLATVQAAATAVDPAEIEAYLEALELPELTAEQAALLQAFLAEAVVYYDPNTQTLTLSATFTEAAYNVLVDEALVMAGYAPEEVTVDFVTGGMVFTISGYTLENGSSGTLSVYITLATVNGQVTYDIASATLNGFALPAAALTEVEALVQSVIDPIQAALPQESYDIQSLVVTDTTLAVIVTVYATN